MSGLKLKIFLVLFLQIFTSAQFVKAEEDAQEFLRKYSDTFRRLDYVESLANWRSSTLILPCKNVKAQVSGLHECDKTNSEIANAASEAVAHFTGQGDIIKRARKFLADPTKLSALQKNALENILYRAAKNPQTVPDIVKRRIFLDTKLNEKMFGFKYVIDGKEVTVNDIDRILKESKDLPKRLRAWNESKRVGLSLRDDFFKLRDLRNKIVQAAGYRDYFSYQVSNYGISKDEMLAILRTAYKDLYPLYRELHTFARYELARKFGTEKVPENLPAHWLPNRWGQNWDSIINVSGINLDDQIKSNFSPERIIEISEKFYTSVGFPNLPRSFHEKSSLFPLNPKSNFKKNTHPTAWHLDLDQDVRSIMNVEANTYWYQTTHHELGHIYYFMEYSRPEIPLLLRTGANRAFHEGLGTLLGLAAVQPSYLKYVGLDVANVDNREARNRKLLREALRYVVELPWQYGVMTNFEHALYSENIKKNTVNTLWWKLKKKYQGIVPPEPRGPEFADALSKTHIINDPAQYYDYALANLTTYLLHKHIAEKILKQDIYDANYYGKTEVGNFLKRLMRPGASRDWRELLKELTGQDMDGRAMFTYFEPLLVYLRRVNAGRTYTMPESPPS